MAKKILNEEKINDLRFTVSGNLINELGEESISNDNVAIAELIKNAYDADSSVVNLDFLNPEKHNASIMLSDDGSGMAVTDIIDKFMEIGSPHKKSIYKTDLYDRVPVGAKGIGRFASHGLGHSLELRTSVKGDRSGFVLDFDWDSFTPKVKATDVGVPTRKFNKKPLEHGTSLLIKNLKSGWNNNAKTKSLLRDLHLLLSPLDLPKNFKLKQNLDPKGVIIPKINKSFFDKSAYSIKVKLTKNKVINLEFKKLGKIVKKITTELDDTLSCGDVIFEMFFYYKTVDSWKNNTGAEINKKDLDSIRDILEEFGGIKLYRDHFRVKPYGDKRSDWIGLDRWSRDNSLVPANTQVFGIVTIGKEKNPKIEDTTTREGVVANSEYFDLEKFVSTSISQFVSIRNELETSRGKGRKAKAKVKTKTKKIKVVQPKSESGSQAKQDLLINIKGSFPSSHYEQIVHEVNECFSQNYPNACFWLVRKIVENLVTHILEKKYPKHVAYWYDPSKARVLMLSQLIDNLYTNRKDFTAPKVKHQIEIFNADIKPMLKAMNSTVHNNHDYLTDRDDLKKFKINKVMQNLIDIYASI